jgi:uncharacterized protein YndB with AHSA1/START domain
VVRIAGSVEILRPPEEVFDYVADQTHEPSYNPQMARCEQVTPGPITVGTRFRSLMRSRVAEVPMESEVLELDRPHRVRTRTTMDSAVVDGSLTFAPAGAGTRMSWDWDLRPRGTVRLLGPLVAVVGRRQEARIWAGLKRHLEAVGGPT